MTFTTSPNSEIAFWNEPAVPLTPPPMAGDVIVNSLTATTFVSAATMQFSHVTGIDVSLGGGHLEYLGTFQRRMYMQLVPSTGQSP